MDFASKRRERHPLSREHFGTFLRSLGAEQIRPRDMVVGEHLADVETSPARTTRKAQLVIRPRPPAYHLGTLGAARSEFAKATGLTFDWQDEDDTAAA